MHWINRSSHPTGLPYTLYHLLSLLEKSQANTSTSRSFQCLYKSRYNDIVRNCSISIFISNEELLEGREKVDFASSYRQALLSEVSPSSNTTAIDAPVIASIDYKLHVEFENPQFAITPGQTLVFWDGEICLGGAIL